jgi:CTP:molybdopterin cytidylyltransferase MocA
MDEARLRRDRNPVLPVGIVLAGGRSRRLGGGDKGLRPLARRPILAHVIARARPQVAALALDPCFTINRPEDLAAAERLAAPAPAG